MFGFGKKKKKEEPPTPPEPVVDPRAFGLEVALGNLKELDLEPSFVNPETHTFGFDGVSYAAIDDFTLAATDAQGATTEIMMHEFQERLAEPCAARQREKDQEICDLVVHYCAKVDSQTGDFVEELEKLRKHTFPTQIVRARADLEPWERSVLKLAAIMELVGYLDRGVLEKAETSIIWNDGNARILGDYPPGTKVYQQQSHHELVAMYAENFIASKRETRDFILSAATEYVDSPMYEYGAMDPIKSAVSNALFGGTGWLSRADTPGTMFSGDGDNLLILGRMEDGGPLTMHGEGSLLTIAPPGSGKTQVQVFPNLLKYRGAAVVLDVKGECYAVTSDWRREHVGPVYLFSPDEPDISCGFNPLEMVDGSPKNIVADAKRLARLILPAKPNQDEYWVESAMNLIASKIVYLVSSAADGEFPAMFDLVRLMAPTAAEKDAIAEFCANSPVASIEMLWRVIADIPEKTRQNIYSQARTALSAWEGEDIKEVTAMSGWDPREFCDPEQSPTLYLKVSESRLPILGPMLRVILGMHLDLLNDESQRGRDDVPVLFIIDEMPQLGYMPSILKGIETGRSRGVKIWGFAQALDQIRERYGSPTRFHSVVKVVSYMDMAPDTAEMVASQLGEREGLLDGKRKPLAEASELRGPEWRNKVLVIGSGMPPAKLDKFFCIDPAHPLHERGKWPER